MAELEEQAIAPAEVIEAARRRLQALGYPEARPAIPREDPPGVDIVAPRALARVDTAGTRTGADAVVAVAGVAAVEYKTGCLFSLPGFTDEAVAWSDRLGIALFAFDRSMQTQPVGRVASCAVARTVTTNTRFGTGSRADPLQIASLLTEGLVGAEIGEVGLWFGGLGQLLTFRVHPGDTVTPAAVDVTVIPPNMPEPVRLEDWEHVDRRLPGGGREESWTRRCIHANHPPTVVAGDAVLRATEALEACGVEISHGRVELRRGPQRDPALAAEVAATGDSIFGLLTREEPLRARRGEAASPAQIVGSLLRGTEQPASGNGHANGMARAEVHGVDADGDVAWQLLARRTGGRLRQLAPWEIEARVREELLQPNRPHQWFRPPSVDVGATTWQLVRGWWRTVKTGDELEVVAHEVVADLAAAYGLAGTSLERTGLRQLV